LKGETEQGPGKRKRKKKLGRGQHKKGGAVSVTKEGWHQAGRCLGEEVRKPIPLGKVHGDAGGRGANKGEGKREGVNERSIYLGRD